jgi:hypothetical protein
MLLVQLLPWDSCGDPWDSCEDPWCEVLAKAAPDSEPRPAPTIATVMVVLRSIDMFFLFPRWIMASTAGARIPIRRTNQ